MKSLILVLLAAAWVSTQDPPSAECKSKEAVASCLENIDPEKCNDDIPCLCAVYTEANNNNPVSCPDDVEAKTHAETAEGFCNWGTDDTDDTPQ
ncbi:hypothetical protein CDV36_006284 [Fusarium kuroshium]|uniref:Extracellular membrane protein CFEM domain-containing protein n=1 Tax=Fusarium kuroshium TaxID=2010991 RepID=A0A3M2S919_9HYPO|nr:hypothetical protein CDV36_006284 [Fusarium kuroshium]